MRRSVLIAIAVAIAAAGPADGQERLTAAEAERLPGTGHLGSLCPVPDVPMDFRERVSREAMMRARWLILEVRRRPDALVTMRYQDSHTGEPIDETLTVRALAQEHLKQPGPEGVPCHRRLMTELKAAVEGTPMPPGVVNDPVFTLDGLEHGLRLVKRGAVYDSPDGCLVQGLYFTREEVELAIEEPIRNNVVVASPRKHIGVQVFRPDARCRKGIKQDLARVERRG